MFQKLIHQLKLSQPDNGTATSQEQAIAVAERIGYPVVIRPSYVLGGRAMQIIREETQLNDYLLGTLPELVPADVKARYPNDKTGQINTVLGKNPLLFDRYLSDATEIDVDCLCDGKDTFIVGIMEHIEEAGIHSGDSACSLPPHSLDDKMIEELERQTRELALGLDVVGAILVEPGKALRRIVARPSRDLAGAWLRQLQHVHAAEVILRVRTEGCGSIAQNESQRLPS